MQRRLMVLLAVFAAALFIGIVAGLVWSVK